MDPIPYWDYGGIWHVAPILRSSFGAEGGVLCEGPEDHMNVRIRSYVPFRRLKTRRIPETMVCRIFMSM